MAVAVGAAARLVGLGDNLKLDFHVKYPFALVVSGTHRATVCMIPR